ncbi:M81 family metallopeptidase [Roseomonas alkaliterrae]|uniref:Microcystinase C n=1 Tax=Neoroseomonas alkaliterrae TaxID=1452450 RepID=A0A840XM44_9PROT|nr:M81 family metallopeptidase [Neoroseomonas alkaliterrae]MBB5689665.1 microcystin degradation protein MlrC [Neoroseomonas alkaliterrae]MBR0676814.1 M81 family metallopeptidase [Neoroseomonas alkaliterrae]
MTRIAIGGFLHESHSFAPLPTGWAEFVKPGGFPPLQKRDTLLDALRPTSCPAAGAIMVAEEEGVTIAPLAWGFANPAGPVTAEAFERIAALIIAALSDALEEGPLDGVYLDLHGAMVAVGFDDAEAELLRRVRAVVGPDVPIAASLDPHANMTAAMVAHADVLVPFRTYPHVDMKPAGAQAARLLLRMIRERRRPAKAFREIDYWTPLPAQCTMVAPMAEVMAERARLAEAPGMWELGFCFGFPYADFPGCGMAIAAFADTTEQAAEAADALAGFIAAKEPEFALGVLPAAEGVARAMAGSGKGPVVLADTQDNPGGGGHGDTTGLLAELIRQGAEGAVLAPMNDAEAAAACHAAGEGATVTLDLGGRSDGAPLAVTALVERLSDGRFTLTGPMGRGNPADLGPSALIRVAPGVRVIVVSRKMQAHDQAIFRFLGIEPAEQGIVAVKSSVHFRADFQPIAREVIVVAAPGPVVADPAVLPFTNLRPGLRLRPGDNRRTP